MKELQYDGATIQDLVNAYCKKVKVPQDSFKQACDIFIHQKEDLIDKNDTAKLGLLKRVITIKEQWDSYLAKVKSNVLPDDPELIDEPPRTRI